MKQFFVNIILRLYRVMPLRLRIWAMMNDTDLWGNGL
jgi:hypothetical protein